MIRLPAASALALLLAICITGPATAAGKPAVAMMSTGGCDTLSYSWSNQGKAKSAELRIHHFGIFETSRALRPVGSNGSFTMPADVAFVAGDEYTVLGLLLDSAGRAINPSGAVWYGTC